MKINQYIIHMANGDTFSVSASNMSGAKSQVKSISKYVLSIERIYKTGNKSICPW